MPPPSVSPPTPTEAVSPELMPRPWSAQDLGDVTPRRPAADAHEGAVDLHVVQRGEVEGEPAGDAAPRAVPAAAHHDRHMLDRPPSARPITTSATEPTRTIASGSPVPEWKCRAASHPSSPDTRTRSGSAEISSSIRIAQTLPEGSDMVETLLYSQPLRLKIAYSVTLVVAMSERAMG